MTLEDQTAVLAKKKVDGDIEKSRQVSGSLIVDWDGPDDPENPRNWSMGRRVWTTLVPAMYMFAVTFGTSVYVPGVEQIEEQFGISRTVALLGLSVYSQGLAFGPMIGAPISETYGRKAVYMISLPVSLLFTLGSGLSTNTGSLLACRFFASTFGSPALAVGAGTIADIWDMGKGGGMASALVIMSPFMGPTFGPLVGGYTIERRGDWRWLMWSIMMVGGPMLICGIFTQETSKKEILKRRAIRFGRPLPPKPTTRQFIKMLLAVTLFRPLHMLLTEPIVTFISLYVAFAFGVLFAFFDSFPYVYGQVYGFGPGQIGLAFLGVFVGTVLSVVTFGIFDQTLYRTARKRAPRGRQPPPEERLYTSMAGSLGLPLSLFWFAWSTRPSVPWVLPVLAGIPFGWGNVSLFLGTTAYLLDVYHALAGASAMAANGFLRYSFGAAFPLFTNQMYTRLGIPWAGCMLGFFSVLLMPVPWVLYRWGPAIRARSAYSGGNY